MTLGGRASEHLVFGEITTGAANDIEKATSIAKQMIMRFGMSERLEPRTLGHNQSLPFLGDEFSQEPDYSEEVAREIDEEIRRIVEEGRERALKVLSDHRHQLDASTTFSWSAKRWSEASSRRRSKKCPKKSLPAKRRTQEGAPNNMVNRGRASRASARLHRSHQSKAMLLKAQQNQWLPD